MAVNPSSSPSLDIKEPVVAEQWAHTKSKLQKISFTWTINNFSFRHKEPGENLRSPAFYSHTNEEIKWHLNLYPNGVNKKFDDWVSIFLHLLEPFDKTEVITKFKISALSSELNKNVTFNSSICKFKFPDNSCWGSNMFIKREILLDETGCLLSEDKLNILCEVSFVSDNINISSQKDIGKFQIPECKITDDFCSLLENRKFCDVTLEVDKHEFPAHKAILAARSVVFAAMFEHEMKESKLNIVTITDVDHEVLQEMLRFIYTEETPKLKEMANQLLAAADKYALKKLKVMCEEVLFAELSIEAAAETLVLADLHSADQLKEQTLKFIKIHAKDFKETKGWENMMSQKVHLPLIVETVNALLTPQKQHKLVP